MNTDVFWILGTVIGLKGFLVLIAYNNVSIASIIGLIPLRINNYLYQFITPKCITRGPFIKK